MPDASDGAAPGRYVGRPVRRLEDARLLTGRGQYVADLAIPGAAHLVVLRADYPHAEIRGIDTEAARAMPGVLAVLTGNDALAEGLGGIPWERAPPLPKGMPVPAEGDPKIAQPQPILAQGRVRYLGQPVAAVVAETLDQAMDAAEAIIVDYAPLTAVFDPRAAVAPDAPQIWDQAPGNICFRFTMGDAAATDDAFARAAHVARQSVDIGQLVQNPMETRGYVGEYDADAARFTLHAAAGKPQPIGRALARDIFRLPEDRVRVIARDVGGGFGAKNPVYPEQALVLWAARRLGRPVRWIASRSEGFLSDYQGRGQAGDAELALDADGRALALRVRARISLGGYLGPRGATAAIMWRTMGTSVYHFPAVDYDIAGLHTNAVPTCPYRGAGAPEVIFLIERLFDTAARDLGMDPADLRRRNLAPPSAMPYTSAIGVTYDSGDFPAAMDTAQSLADITGFPARRAESANRGKLRGLGYANLLEACGAGIPEKAVLSCTPDGTLALRIGTMSNGQSHETVFAQILAEKLGIGMEQVALIQGDSDESPWGMGTGASRSMTVGGSAVFLAADALIEAGRSHAAEMLEAAAADIEFDDAAYRVAGTDRRVTLWDVADHAIQQGAPADRGLEAEHHYDPPGATFPNGCHIAEVEVDPETGVATLLGYAMAQDVGRAMNPMVVEGQLAGGVAQGIGQALMEGVMLDPESGQLLTGSFMDYGMARADDLPALRTRILEVPCRTTPTGAKSVGEAGPTAAPAAVVNAIVDALWPLGVRHIDMPATPLAVRTAIAAARAAKGG